MKPRRLLSAARLSFPLASAIAALLSAPSLFAASATWNGTTDASWATATNWSVNPVPGTGDTATFNNAGGAVDVIDLGAGATVSTILFDTASAAAYTIGSGAVGSQTLTLNNSGAVTMNATVVRNQLFNAAIGLGTDATAGTYTFTNNSGSLLTFAGGITGGSGGTAGAKTLNLTGTGAITLSGIIGNGDATSVGLTKSGNGMLTLSGNNTFTGVTKLDAGILRATTSINALGVGTELRLTGGTLQLTDGLNFARNTIVGDSTNARTVVIQSDNTALGAGTTSTLGTLLFNNAATTLNVTAGAFANSGTAGVTFGAVTLGNSANTLNTNNSFFNSGVTTTTTLASVGANFGVTFGGTGNTTITGGITGTGALTLTKNGTGTLTLGGGTNPGTGAITINGGTVNIGAGGTLGTRALTFGGTGQLTFNSAATGTVTQSLGALTFSAGQGTVSSVFTTGVTSTAMTFSSLAARTAGATGNFVTTGGTNGTTNSINLTGAALGFQNQGLFFNGSDYAYVNAAGTFVRAPVYGTDTNFSTQGTATTLTGSPTAATHRQITGNITAGVAASLATLKINSGSAVNFTQTTGTALTLGQNGILRTGGSTTTFASSTTTAATLTGTGELVINTNAAADAITFSGTNPVVITGFAGLTKTGAGTLNMANVANTFAGNININGGTLAITGPGGTTDPTGLGAAGARSVTLNGGTFQVNTGGYNPGSGTKTFVVGPSGGTFNVTGQTLILDDASQLSGSGNLTLNATAAGALNLGGNYAAFTGNIFVNGGTLRLFGNDNAAGVTGNSIVMANNASALDLQRTTNSNVFVGGTGLSGAGAIISSATGGGMAATTTLTLTANTSITAANGITLSGTVTDAGRGFGITKTGSSWLTLNGANTFSGGVTIAATNTGQLALGNNSALGTGPLTVLAGATASSNIVASSNLVMTNPVVLGANMSFGFAGNSNVGNMTFGALDLGGGAPRTITVPIPNMTTTFTGAVTNGTGLTVTGLGTLALAGTGSFTGPVTNNGGGTLSVGATTLNAAGSVSIGTTLTSGLNFNADNVGSAANLASNTTVALGGAASQALLGFQLGDTGNYDSLNLTGATGNVTVGAGGAVISIIPLTGFAPAASTTNTYNLITTSGGGTISNSGNITLPFGALPTGYNYSFTTSSTAVVLGVTSGAAGNLFWRGDVNNSWNAGTGTGATNTNWNDAADAADALFAPNATNTVNFSSTGLAGATPVTTTLDQNFSVAGIVVNNTNTGALTVSQGTFGTLTLGTGGITVDTGGPASTTLNAPITLGGTQTWTVTDAGQTLSIHGAAPARGIVSGAFGVTLAGAGTVTLGGFNTFSGGLTTGAGQVNINNGGSTTTNSALGTGTVNFAGATTTLDNTSGVAQSVLTTGAQTWGGNVVFTGTNSLSLGTGGITLGANRQVTVNGGTLQLGGVIANQAFGITKLGTGALTLSGANLNTGGFVLSAGRVNVNNAAALGAATATVALNGGTIDNTSGAAIVSTAAGLMTFGADVVFGASATAPLSASLTLPGAVTLTADRSITVNASGMGVVGNGSNFASLTGIIGGNTFTLTKLGKGTLNLNGVNTFGGAGKLVTLSEGTLSFGNPGALGNVANTFVISASPGAAVAVDSNAAIGLAANPWTVSSDFAYLGSSAGLNNQGATVALGAATRTITLMGNASNRLTFGGIISADAGVGLTANGIGFLDFYGASSYTGAATINSGATLSLGMNNGVANAAGSLSSATLVLNGGTLAYARTGTVSQSFAGGTTIGSGAAIISETVAASQTLNLGGLGRAVANGGTVNFSITGTPAGTTGITTSTGNTAGILGGWATLGGLNWAVANGATSSITAYAAYTPSIAGTTAPGAGTNVDFQASNSTPWTTQGVNSLAFRTATATSLTLTAGNTLTLDSGGILVNSNVAGNASTITGGTIATTGDLIITNFATSGTLNLNSVISAAGLTKSGTSTGAAIIGGTTGNITNSLTGTVTVNAGVLQVNSTSATGGNGATGALNSLPITLNGGTLALNFDGDGTGTPDSIALTDNVTLNGNAIITAQRLGGGNPIGSTLFTQSVNKTLQLGTLTFGNDGRTLTVTPSNGYGLEFTGTTTLDKNLTTINVGQVTASNVVQGLTLSGKVTGTIAGGSWTKAGAGTIVLNNASNDFTSNMTLSAGALAFNSDAALGNAANTITLTGTTAATALRAYGGTVGTPLSIDTGRTINLWGNTTANNVIEVAANTMLTLNAAFGGGNSPFTKADIGTLVLNADNGIWAGQLSIAAGAVRVTNAGALGISTSATAGNTVVAATGGALQLSGVSIWDQLNIQGTGINTGGALQAVGTSSTSTTNGLITLPAAATIGADSTDTLNIRGGITGGFALTFAGAGTINVDTNPIANGTGIVKIGSGTTTLAVASPGMTGSITVNAGTLALGGVLGAGAGSVGGFNAININPGGILSVDNTVGTGVDNRLGGGATSPKTITMTGGNFNYIGHASLPSSETLGALTINRGESTITVTAGVNAGAGLIFGAPAASVGATALFRGSNLGSAPGNGVATIGSTTTGFTFVGAGAAGTINKGILPWALVDASASGTGTSFATADTVTGNLRALTSSEYVTSLGGLVSSANLVLGAADRLAGSSTINSLTLTSTGAVTLNPLQTLTVGGGATLGGVLNTAATTISGGLVTSGGTGGVVFHANANLTLDSVLVGSAGGSPPYLTKTGAGTLTLNKANAFIGQTAINQGTLKLAGGNNTLFMDAANSYMAINAGGTLDLNGNSQQVRGLFSDGAYSTPTAIITGGAGSTLVTNSDARGWGGVITGSVAFQRGGTASVTSFYSDNDYSGATLISGGTIRLQDAGRLSGTSSIGIDYGGQLIIDNQIGTVGMADRVRDLAPVAFRGGNIVYNGRNNNANNVEVLGALNLAQGASQFNMTAGTGITTNELRFTSFTRNADATTNVQTASGQIGSAARLYFPGAETLLVNNILPWAASGGNEFMSYNAIMGIAPITAAGYAGYDGTVIPGTTQPTQNIRTAAAGTVAASMGLNSLSFGGAHNVTFGAGGVSSVALNLTSGGLLKPGSSGTLQIGDVVDNGHLTAGGTADTIMDRLFIHSHAGTLTINSRIVDNGSDAVRLVYTGYNVGNLSLTNGANSYSGGTVVNGWAGNIPSSNVLQLNGGVGQVVIPAGGLTLNNGAVTMVTNGGQINSANTVTLNGPSTLTLVGANSLAGLEFNVDGGANTGPTVATGAGALTLTGGITAGGSNPNALATISGSGGLNLNGTTNYAMEVNGFSFNSQLVAPLNATLSITAPIANGGIVKTGDGLLSLGGANTFASGVDLQVGGIAIANNAAIGTGGALLISGNNTTLTADATSGRTVANNVIFGNAATTVNLGNYGSGTLTLSGPTTWSTTTGVARTLNVNAVTGGGVTINPQTLGGVITSAGTGNQIIKQGIGTLAITGNNAATLDWTGSQAVQISNGTLLIGADTALGAVPGSAVADNIVINGGALAYSSGFALAANRGISLGSSNGVIDSSTFPNAVIAGTIGGAGGLVKNGAGTLTLSGVNSFTGGVFATAGTLVFTNAAAPTFTGLSVAGGATLNMLNNAGQAINLGSGALNLGAGTGAVSLGLELLNTGAYDSFTTTGTASNANTVILNMTRLAGATGGTFTLLSAASGLNTSSYVLNPAGWSVSAYSVTSTAVQVTASPLTSDLFWSGAVNLSWGGLDGSFNSNFSTDLAGTNAKGSPGMDQGLTFSANGLTATTLSTTLDINSSIRDLTFSSNVGSGPLATINIAPGVGGTLSITPTVSTAGINVQAGAPAAINISAPVTLGASQTWSVADAATVLAVSGNITATANLIKDGSGIVELGGTNTYAGTTTINNGVLRAGAANGLNAGSAFTVGTTGTLRLNGFAAAVGSLAGPAGAIVENFNATGGTLTAGADNTSTNFAGTIQNGTGAGALGLTKVGNGTLTLSGTYSHTGATSVNGGTVLFSGTNTGTSTVTANNAGSIIKIGSATGLTASNPVSITAGTTFDLNGNTVSIGGLTSVATSTITNSSTGIHASTATSLNTPSGLVDALNTLTGLTNLDALITDGATRKTQITLNNGNGGAFFNNTANTFSGGVVLLNSGTGTRLSPGTIVGTPYGSGPIIIGQAATDKAGIYFANATTFNNPIIFNTALGTDRVGVRADAALTLTGVITANLAPATFTSNAGTGASVLLTGQVTGISGLVIDITSLTSATTSFNVTLNNSGAANDYAGNTVINVNPLTGKSATLNLGQANQLPNGAGKGNVVINTNGTGVGTLNMAGFSDTINGLIGNGTVEGTSGAPTLTLGDGNATGNDFSGVIKNTAGTLGVTKIGTGTQTLSGPNTFSGILNVDGGKLAFAAANNLGNATASNTIGINGGTLSYTGAGAVSLAANQVVNLGASHGIVEVSQSTGALTLPGGVNSTNNNLTKTGLGSLIISGTSNLGTGNVAVDAGALIVNSALTSSAVTVANTATLGGTGTLTSAVTINSGGTLSPATGTTAGTLTIGSLTLDAGSLLAYEFGGTNDLVAVTTASGLTVNGGALSLYAAGGVSPLTANGTYDLFTYSTGFGGSLSNLTVANSQGGKTYSIFDNTGISIQLVLGTATSSDWSGTIDGDWTNDGAGKNWNGGAQPNSLGAVANFGNLAVTPQTVTLNGGKTVGSILFNNANSFTIGTTADAINLNNGIAAGSISSTSGNHTIDAPIALTGPANITPGTGLTLTFGGIISGTGKSLTFSGAGTSVLEAANTYSGGTTLSNGTLNLAHDSALGGAAGTLTIGAGTTIDNTKGSLLTIANDNAQKWNGSFTFTGTESMDLGSGTVTLGATPTITTNGLAATTLTVGGAIGDGVNTFGLTKAGPGTLALGGTSTYNGATSITAGTLSLTGSLTGGGAISTSGTGILTQSAAGVISGASTVTQGSSGTSVLAGNNTYTGINTITAGTLQVNSASGGLGDSTAVNAVNLNSGTLSLRNDGAGNNGSILYGSTSNPSGYKVQLSATSTINVDNLTANAGNTIALGALTQATAAIRTLNVTGANGYSLTLASLALNPGAGQTTTLNPTTASLIITGNVTNPMSGFGGSNFDTLTLGGTSTGNSIGGSITDAVGATPGAGGRTIVSKGNTSTWTLSGLSATAASNYTGATVINEGTLAITHATTAALTGGLTFGAAAANTTVSTLDLTGANATFAGAALVQTNSASANTISIGASKTLTLNGGLTIGYAASAGSATNTELTASTGSMVVNGTNLIVGVSGTGAENSGWFNRAVLDVSDLASFTTNVTNLNVGKGDNIVPTGSLVLSDTANLIQATTLTVGDTGGSNGKGTSTLTLGAQTNVIRANTIEIGKGKNSGPGVVTFLSQTPAIPGSVTITDKAGTGAANITIANGNSVATGGGAIGTLDLRGHVATVSAGTLLISQANAGSNNSGTNGTLRFDAGTFTVATLNMAPKTGASTGTATALLEVGGGNFTVNTAFTLGSQATAGFSVATLNLTGGTFTSNPAITQGGGFTTSTINLDGGTLDMTSDAIGTGANTITLNAQQGTLQNLAELNGGGALTKTTAGTLIMGGTNTYTGATTVSEGRLNVNGSITSSTSVGTGATAATLGGDGTITGDVNIGANGTLLPGQGGMTDRNMNVTGNVTAAIGAQVTFNITNETDFDQLSVGGSMDLTNLGLNLNNSDTTIIELGAGLGDDFLTLKDSFSGTGSFYKLISGTTTGMFSNVTDTMTAGELEYYQLTGPQYRTSISGQNYWVANGSTYLIAIPEPGTLALLGLGSLGLALRRRRTNHQS